MLEFIILGLLMSGRLSGYDMKKTMDSSVGLFYSASFGSLYPALKRMTDKGLIIVIEVESSSKNKKLYELQPSGKDAFLNWLAEPLELSRNELLSKLFFYDHLPADIRVQRLNEYEYKIANEIGRLRAVEQIVKGQIAQIPNPQDYFYRVSVLSYGLSYFEMVQQWIKTIKERNDDHASK